MNLKQVFNPYLPSWEYIPDGEPHIFGDRLYVFGSHDRFNGDKFCMNDYVGWSCPTDDLSDWRFEGIIYRKEQDPSADGESIMQAPDVCQGPDGRYYLYYTLGMSPFMAVAVCDTPAGKYEYYGIVSYADGTPVGMRKDHDLFQFDPGIFRDDDGQIYLYSGFGIAGNEEFASAAEEFKLDGAYCMELQEDMLTVKKEPVKILSDEGEHGFYEASSMRKIDGKYYFIYSSVQQHELCYAVSDRPDGDFSYQGVLVSIGDLGLSKKARNYLGNTHGSLVQVKDKWYIFYHRQTNRQQYSRQACAEEIEFKEGKFKQAEITSCGLNGGPLNGTGTYEARIACNLWSKDGTVSYGLLNTPEAENHPYFTQSGADRECNGDQYIANMRDGATAVFKYFEFKEPESISIDADCGDGEMWIYTDLKEKPVCRIDMSKEEKEGKLSFISGKKALYFVYHGEGMISFYRFTII